MAFGSIIDGLSKLARVALAAMVLVVVPLADAATCIGEETHAAVELGSVADEVVADDQPVVDDVSESRSTGGDQHCVHGHCHHGVPYKASEQAAELLTVQSREVFVVRPEVDLSGIASGLERPPRA